MSASGTGAEDLFGAPEPPRTKRVLLVEDSVLMRQVVSSVIRDMGHEIEEAGNGVEGLAAARRAPPDLIFLDLHMPEMDGLRFLEQLRTTTPLMKVPVVLLTVVQDRDTITRAASYGVRDYLSKPARPCRIREKVQAYLG